MDPNENPVKRIVSLLEPHKLETPYQMAVQLAGCTRVFDSVDVSSLLDGLFDQEDSTPNTLALLVSSCPSETISGWLLEHFPADYYSELTSNAPFKAFSMLSRTLISLMNTSQEIAPEVMRNHYLVSVAPQLLVELLSFGPTVITSAQAKYPVGDEDKGVGGIRVRHKGQVQGKRGWFQSTQTSVSPLMRRHLLDLGLPLPLHQSDRERIAQAIIDYLQRALALSLYELKQPATRSAIRKLFYKPSSPPAPALVHQRSISEADDEQIPTSPPQVQPMQESLYFDSVAGFGLWKIQIAGTVEKRFRELRRVRPNQFKAIVRKIRELSRGHFYDNNKILLNEPDAQALSVFEARLGGTGIVYQIDCAWDNETELDTQVIKIYGVYAHSKIDKKLWNSVAIQLGSKGEEYRYRCEFRNPVTNGGSNFDPATFDPIEGGLPIGQVLLEIDNKILEEMHAILTLEKFITFSQALLNSILANVEVMLPFEMTAQEKELVRHSGSSFVIGRSGTGKTTSVIYKMLAIERAYAPRLNALGVDRPRQVFVTQSKVLATRVQEHFDKLLDSLGVASQSREEFRRMQLERRSHDDDVMVDEDEEDELSAELPPRFSLLKPEHFPLFISFDRLCKLIEGDVLDMPNTRAQSVITYKEFFEFYWQHFPRLYAKGLDPVSLFSEFIGVIKGSEDTLKTRNGYLDDKTYKSLSHRTQPAFAHHRNAAYKLFMNYQKRKASRGESDRADRTHKILEALKNNRIELLGTRIDFLYVDESQDNLLIDALLLRLICKNPSGFFFAGDTAQTISAGCSFRFDDLKAMMYRAEECHSATFGVALPHSSPKTFQLAVNYRSHGGIVDAARSITELITHFFPYSIDNLEPERGVVPGSKPVFFQGFEEFSTTAFEKFFFGDREDHVEFGAAQCILVRDEAAQARLAEKVGDIGLVMTLYDCKGLEFNDVLLFNFFDGSPVELKSWQALLNAVPLELGEHAPAFDEFRHASISSELKKLYVAVTRAKKNLWIVDQSEKSEPMRRLWASKGQISCRTPEGGIPQLTIKSSEDEWAKQGLNMFRHKRYYQARDCYKRARLAKEVDICQAYCLRDEAQKLTAGTNERKRITAKNQAFITAAEAFRRCAQHPAEKGEAKRAYLRISGECYEAAQELELASEAYIQSLGVKAAARMYRRLEMFEPAVDLIRAHGGEMDSEVTDEIMNVARLHYFTKQDFSKANALFSSSDEAIAFLKDRDLNVTAATLLESLGKNVEAAQIHLNEGRVLQAAELFFKDPANQEALRLGVDSLVPTLWKCISFGSSWKKGNNMGHELLGLLDTVDLSLLDSARKDEVDMFRVIARYSPAHPEFERLGRAFAAASNWPASLLCFDFFFTNTPQVQVVRGSEAVEIIEDFLHYVRMLREVALHPDPQNEERFQKLFGFVPHSSAQFLVLQGTALYIWIRHSRSVAPRENNDYGLVVSGNTLCSLLKEFLRLRITDRIKSEHRACCQAQALDPCLFFTLQGHCEDLECKRQHIAATAATELVANYRTRVRLHMQQFLILQIWHLEAPQKHEAAQQLNEWVDRLYRAMFPPHPALGVLSDLDIKAIPEFGATLNLLRTVSRNITYREVPTQFSHTQPWLMTGFMQIAFYGFTYDRIEASAYVKRAAYLTAPNPPSFIRERTTFIISDIFFSYMGKERSLANGVSLIRHIVNTRLCVDVGVFCDYIDRQVALFCATQKWNSSTPLHALTLPRSWMLHLLQSSAYTSLYDITRRTAASIKLVVDLLIKLTSDIYRHTADYLFYDGESLSQLGPVIVSTFVLRLFRAISYLGYNACFDVTMTRLAITRFFLSFRGAFTVSKRTLISKLLASYTNISDWGGIVRLIHEVPFKADIAIRLQYLSEDSYESLGIQAVTFTALDDALVQLGQSTPAFKALASDPGPSRNRPASLKQDMQPGTEGAKAVQEKHESGVEVNRNGLKAVPLAQDEISAARKIQSTYRGWKKRVKFQSSNKESYHTHYLRCVKEAQGLPYILDTLDKLSNRALSLKEETKQQLNTADISNFEIIDKKLTVLVNVLKEIKNIQLALQPKSNVHGKRDLKAFRENVQMVWDIFHRKGEGWDHGISSSYLEDGYGIIMKNSS